MAFDLATDPMTSLNIAIIAALHDADIHEGYIEQGVADATVIFKPQGRLTTAAAMVAVHAVLADRSVAVLSNDTDAMGMVRIVFGRADDGTIAAPEAKRDHDALLDDWFLCCSDRTSLIVGTVRDDSKGRWPDGTTISTSVLQAGSTVGEGLIVRTLNSAYLLGTKKADDDLNDGDMLGSLLLGHPAVGMQVRN